jgi:hypothetical protein
MEKGKNGETEEVERDPFFLPLFLHSPVHRFAFFVSNYTL